MNIKWIFHQNKNGSGRLQRVAVAVVLDDADGAECSEAEEEAIDEVPAVADAEQRGAGRNVAKDQQQADPDRNQAGIVLEMLEEMKS
jgi:hypothetical protein